MVILTSQRFHQYLNLAILCLTGVVLIALQEKPLGWYLLGLGVVHLLVCGSQFLRHMGLVYLSLVFLGYTPISTSIELSHMVEMGLAIGLALVLPFLISHFIFKESIITYPLNWPALRQPKNIAWLVFAGLLSVIVIPFYLLNTGAWENWYFGANQESILRLFAGTNGLGVWDELFFINTILALLRQHFSFKVANAAQAVLLTSFLFELGFIGWAPWIIYPFALIQGITFARTHSLAYVIAIHLTIDLALFLSLLFIRHPNIMPFG